MDTEAIVEVMAMVIPITTTDITMLLQDITEAEDIMVMTAIITEITLITTMIVVCLIIMILTTTPEGKCM
jgi:hypothetical protein